MSPRILYLDSFAGIAGDMFTAAFLDAGLVDPEQVQRVPEALGYPRVQVVVSTVQRSNARFTHVQVIQPEGSEVEARAEEPRGHHHRHHHHHHYSDLVKRLEGSDLEPAARDFALRVFRLLAEAEAHSHGVPMEEVAFHEVGDVDSVVDVAMAGVCMAAVEPDKTVASPIKLGRGTVRIQHGVYPVPPPASARLSVGMPVAPVPQAITKEDVELSTPTGLAILRALEPTFSPAWPAGTLVAQGSGAGSRDLGEYPNIFRIALLEGADMDRAGQAQELPYRTDQVAEIRCNVDDQTGERTAWLMEKGLELGALDGWIHQVLGKKGRPALIMSFLALPEDIPVLSDFLLRHGSTFGVRHSVWDRFILERTEEGRSTPGGPVSYKVGKTTDGAVLKEKPEYRDLAAIWEKGPDFLPRSAGDHPITERDARAEENQTEDDNGRDGAS
jgi:uncharacterized protein (TIGR00299 family) protein